MKTELSRITARVKHFTAAGPRLKKPPNPQLLRTVTFQISKNKLCCSIPFPGLDQPLKRNMKHMQSPTTVNEVNGRLEQQLQTAGQWSMSASPDGK